MPELNLHSLPQDVEKHALAGSTVVMIDALRASATICQALASGAIEVVPFLEVADALAAAEADRTNVILGGERKGVRIEGFDLGNSPSEYTPEAVGGRRVFLTTTNGTRALDCARRASRVLIGSFLNRAAAAASLQNEPRVEILCAGTDGRETREDLLMAGALISKLMKASSVKWKMNHPARIMRKEWDEGVAADAFRRDRTISEQVIREIREAPGGSNLIEIGMGHDLVTCTQMDVLDVVPELDVSAWRITR